MKTKLVLWGHDDADNKVLIAAQLRGEDNKVDVWTFSGEAASTDLHNALLFEWREGKESAFPSEGYQHYESELTVAESFLPEQVKTDQTDLIVRAQTEWHFVVLSTKLYHAYQSELEDFKDKIEGLNAYDSGVWENLKQFWDKVREQVREKNLSRGHADGLRDQTNRLFSKMKELNAKLNQEFISKAEETKKKFEDSLAAIEARLEKNENLNRLFEELKGIQREFKNAKLTRDLRTKVWNRIDAVFKAVKLKRFGPEAVSGNSKKDRIQRRYEGLLNAIKRMEDSIRRDESELTFQRRKINSTNTGQLESQIREAKVQMIQQRVNSKKEKLEDMLKTKAQLDKQLEKIEKDDQKREKKKQEKQVKQEESAKKEADTPKDPPILVPVKNDSKPSSEEGTTSTETSASSEEKTETPKMTVVKDEASDNAPESANEEE